MRGILADANCEGHVRALVTLLHEDARRELWEFLNMTAFTLDEIGLPSTVPDRVLWEECQRQQLILVTGNRNQEGGDSLEAVIRSENTAETLPIITISNPKRLFVDRSYSDQAADRLLQYVSTFSTMRTIAAPVVCTSRNASPVTPG